MTDGRAPAPEDVDVILDKARAAGFGTPLVFNCQLGAGRTTTGTVIGGLLDMYASAASPRASGVLPAAVAEKGGAGAGVAVVSLMRKASSGKSLEELPLAAIAEAMQGGSPRSGGWRSARALARGVRWGGAVGGGRLGAALPSCFGVCRRGTGLALRLRSPLTACKRPSPECKPIHTHGAPYTPPLLQTPHLRSPSRG